MFLRVRTPAIRLPCGSGAAVLASGNTWAAVFCLLPGPESHSGNAFGLPCSALTPSHSKMLPPSGTAVGAEARILSRLVPSGQGVALRPARTHGATVLASETRGEWRAALRSGLSLPRFDVWNPFPRLSAPGPPKLLPPTDRSVLAKSRFLHSVVPSREVPGT